jgi:hypothetical protein
MKANPDLVKALLVMAELFSKEFSEAGAQMMVQDLSEYPVDQVLAALRQCRLELRTFPTVADVVSRIPGQGIDYRSRAIEIAGRIMKSVTFLGPYKAREARQEVGEVGWAVVSMSGGWPSICEMSDKEIGVRMPQWTNMAESMLRRGVTPPATRLEGPKSDRIQIKMPEWPKEKK